MTKETSTETLATGSPVTYLSEWFTRETGTLVSVNVEWGTATVQTETGNRLSRRLENVRPL